MTAKEMFEGIGYKLSKAYSEDTLISYFDGKKNITIEFYIKNKQFKKAKGVFDCVAIKESELKAIIQQCKELGWLEEKQAIKSETNIEHYFEYLSKVGLEGFALVNGRFTKCSGTCCSECDFNGDCNGNCKKKRLRWLASPYRKKYKLTKFENDLLQSYVEGNLRKFMCKDISALMRMKEKGYFKGIDFDLTIDEILENCEVI